MKKLLLAMLMLPMIGANAQDKKVILEDYTGEWCGWCPEGTVVLEGLEVQHPVNFLPLANHNADPYEIPDGAAIDVALNVTGYPNGSIDRKLMAGEPKIPVGRNKWANYVTSRLAVPAVVSVSFANMKHLVATDEYEADIKVVFSSAPKAGVPLKLQVYILEDSIISNSQSNYSGSVQGGADPLVNWAHNHTLRKALGGTWGFADLPATPAVGTTYTKNIKFKLDAPWKKNQIHLYAFVAYDGTAAADQKEIINAEEMSLKAFHPVGVAEVRNLEIVNAYPNPAKVNDIIRLEYNLAQNSHVTLKVYNAIGQVVATPYDANEGAGMHTIRWRASDNDLTPGMYILELSDANGKNIQKINIH